MTKITSFETFDLRFPTSANLDGSDAMNPDPDYSAAYVVLHTDQPGLDGARKVGVELKMPFAIYVPPAKDVREFLRLGGTRLMLENTLKGILWQNG